MSFSKKKTFRSSAQPGSRRYTPTPNSVFGCLFFGRANSVFSECPSQAHARGKKKCVLVFNHTCLYFSMQTNERKMSTGCSRVGEHLFPLLSLSCSIFRFRVPVFDQSFSIVIIYSYSFVILIRNWRVLASSLQ